MGGIKEVNINKLKEKKKYDFTDKVYNKQYLQAKYIRQEMEIYDVKSTTQHSGTNLYKTKQNRTEQNRTNSFLMEDK